MRHLWVFLALTLVVVDPVGSVGQNSDSFFRTEDRQILDREGKPILLRGLGLGGWLMPEGYMLHFPGYGSPTSIRNDIEGLVGPEVTNEFFERYRANYVAEKDVAAIASWGFNHLRLPFHFDVLYDAQSGNFREEGFELVDQFVEWCRKYGLYVILDMHALPGGQNPHNISDSDGTARLWTEPDVYQPMTIKIWEEIARRYAHETLIIGYDLINEPVLPDGVGSRALRDFYSRLSQAVRAIDPNHIIFIEGNWFATDFTDLAPPVIENSVYAFHKYWNSTDFGTIRYLLDLSQQTNTPLWLGETGENSNDWFFEVVQLAETYGIGWNWWTHKKIATVTSPLSAPIKPGYQSVLDYLAGNASKPTAEFAARALLEMADGLAIDSCDYRPDVPAALLDPGFGSSARPYREHVIPGTIMAWEYDIGRNGIAYSDDDFKNESGSPGIANTGGEYRNDGVDIERSSDQFAAGFNVGWIEDEEWLRYSIDVQRAGSYEVGLRISSLEGGGRVRILVDGIPALADFSIPATGGWQQWQAVSIDNLEMSVGSHVVRLVFERGGFNLSMISFELEGGDQGVDLPFRPVDFYPNPASNLLTVRFDSDRESKAVLSLYDILGRHVAQSSATFRSGRQKMTVRLDDSLAPGVYMFDLEAGDDETTVRYRDAVIIGPQ